MNIYLKKDSYFICNVNIFCIKIYFSNDSFIFFSVKTFFPVKKVSIENFFFNLVFQQMNNHNQTYRNGLNRGPQSWGTPSTSKSATVLVWHLLLGIRILVYSCTGCSTSKIYLGLEDNRSSFSRVSLKSETKDVRP